MWENAGPYAWVKHVPGEPIPATQPNAGSVKRRNEKKRIKLRKAFILVQVSHLVLFHFIPMQLFYYSTFIQGQIPEEHPMGFHLCANKHQLYIFMGGSGGWVGQWIPVETSGFSTDRVMFTHKTYFRNFCKYCVDLDPLGV